MAKPAITPTKTYRVKLARPIEVAPGVWARPEDDLTMLGSLLASQDEEKIESYVEI